MTLYGYARVSTAEQSADLQIDALKRAGVARIFSDKASGADPSRPGLARAIKACKPGDSLIVWKLDRLGRSVRNLVELIEGLKSNNVGFRSLTDAIDTSTPAGRLFFHVMAALAEMERDLIRERTLAGLASARGRRGGRPRKLSAAQIDNAKTILVHGNKSYREVARDLNVHHTTLHKALNPSTQ